MVLLRRRHRPSLTVRVPPTRDLRPQAVQQCSVSCVVCRQSTLSPKGAASGGFRCRFPSHSPMFQADQLIDAARSVQDPSQSRPHRALSINAPTTAFLGMPRRRRRRVRLRWRHRPRCFPTRHRERGRSLCRWGNRPPTCRSCRSAASAARSRTHRRSAWGAAVDGISGPATERPDRLGSSNAQTSAGASVGHRITQLQMSSSPSAGLPP